jgi:hypothetical protein
MAAAMDPGTKAGAGTAGEKAPFAPLPPAVVERPARPVPPIREDFASLPLRGCDYFVLSFDTLSHKTGQGGHKAHSFLVLDRVPDVARLRETLDEAARAFPMLNAQLRRKWLVGPPEWRPASRPVAPELNLHSEEGSPGALLAMGAKPCADAAALMEDVVNTPLPRPGPDMWPKARFTLIETRDGGATLIFSWSHLMMDGVGAELFLTELERIATGGGGEPIPPLDPPPAREMVTTLAERWRSASPLVRSFRKLIEKPFDCLGPRKPEPGRTHFQVHTLTQEQTRAANERCTALGGGLVNLPFYLAAAMRAHERVFAMRGQSPASHMCSVPVQTRRKGARGPLFQNHVTMFFGALPREEVGQMETAVALLTEQQTMFLRERMGDALNDLMHTMRMMPPGLYMEFVSKQMRGPFASFFHSHTGEFAAGLNSFLGARVTGAFHVPGIATPPGTGIFCNEKNGRLVITMCWHENALAAGERKALLDQFLADLGVKK